MATKVPPPVRARVQRSARKGRPQRWSSESQYPGLPPSCRGDRVRASPVRVRIDDTKGAPTEMRTAIPTIGEARESYCVRLERERSSIRLLAIERLARALGVEAWELLHPGCGMK